MENSKEKPFVVYLDIDGVLVSYLNLKERHPVDCKHDFRIESVIAFNRILELIGPNVEVCVVSTWARGKTSDYMKKILELRGIFVENVTVGEIDHRAKYVLERKKQGYNRFLIIDDEAHEYFQRMNEIGYNRILNTNSYRGLDNYDVVSIERNLSRIIKVSEFDI